MTGVLYLKTDLFHGVTFVSTRENWSWSLLLEWVNRVDGTVKSLSKVICNVSLWIVMPGGVSQPKNETFKLLDSCLYRRWLFICLCELWHSVQHLAWFSPGASPHLTTLICHLTVYPFVHHHLHPVLVLLICLMLFTNLCSCSIAYCDHLGKRPL